MVENVDVGGYVAKNLLTFLDSERPFMVTFHPLRNISDSQIQNSNVALNTTYIETEIKK